MNSNLKAKIKALKQAEEKAIKSMTPEKHEELIRNLIESGVIIDSGGSYEDYGRAGQKAPQSLKSSMILTSMTGQRELTTAYRQESKPLSRIILTPKGYKSVYIRDQNVIKQSEFLKKVDELNEIKKALKHDPEDKELTAEKDIIEDKLQSLVQYDQQISDVEVNQTLEERDYERLARGLELYSNDNKQKFSEYTDDELKDDLVTKLDAYLTHIQTKLDEQMSGDDIDKFGNFSIYEGTAPDSASDTINSKFKFALKGISINFQDYLNQIHRIETERNIDLHTLHNKLADLDFAIRDASNRPIVSKLGDTLVNKHMIAETKDRVTTIQQRVKSLKTYLGDIKLYAKE